MRLKATIHLESDGAAGVFRDGASVTNWRFGMEKRCCRRLSCLHAGLPAQEDGVSEIGAHDQKITRVHTGR